MARRKQYLQKVQAEHPEWKHFDKPLRVVTVREDVLTDCPLYGRVAGEFTRLGEARDYLSTLNQTPNGHDEELHPGTPAPMLR